MKEQHFIITTACWGKHFQTFINGTLKSLCFTGNLSIFSKASAEFHIYCEHENIKILMDTKEYHELKRSLKIIIHDIKKLPEYVDKTLWYGNIFNYSLSQHSENSKTTYFFVMADHFYSENCFKNALERIETGANVVGTCPILVNGKGFLSDYNNLNTVEKTQFNSRNMVEIAVKNLHQIELAKFIENKAGELSVKPPTPRVHWHLSSGGFFSKNAEFFTFCLTLNKKAEIDTKIAWDFDCGFLSRTGIDIADVSFMTDSDEFFVVDLSPSNRNSSDFGTEPLHKEKLIEWIVNGPTTDFELFCLQNTFWYHTNDISEQDNIANKNTEHFITAVLFESIQTLLSADYKDEEHNARFRRELSSVKDELNSIKNSTLWKFTSTLRLLPKIFS